MKIGYILKTGIFATFFLSASVLSASETQQQLVRQMTTVHDTVVWNIPVNDITMKRNGDLLSVGMDIAVGQYPMHGDKVTVLTPMLVNGKDTLSLNSTGLYSRIRYIQYLRDGREPVSGPDETAYKYSKRPAVLDVKEALNYDEWMNGATLYLERCDYGCCHTLTYRDLVPLGRWHQAMYTPAYHYVTPEAELVKLRELKGRAYIDFPVNMTNLYPDYRKNPIELQKIIATIDSVRNDEDVTIKEITIKGYASPESSWSNNTRLAMGRTATLKNYVQNLYRFDENLLKTDFTPEDWEGLREFVAQSGLEHRDEILALIDDQSIEPDPKEALLKKRYPQEYDFLLKNVYPALRHSDYTIEYTIRLYTTPDDIKRVMAEAPQKLSLNEFFVLAQSLQPGSDEYNEVFETAVRMYPNDEVANLNAANSAMQRGDMTNAARYLEKAGDSADAVYARGVYAAQTGDYDRAAKLFRQVADTIPEAADALTFINELIVN
ncbi:MAG: tetratricopeptide repeat protein [Muribaculaceae bacterium]|nr:tetratricopeptide repeat protein [Muribaculaceae bacterium]